MVMCSAGLQRNCSNKVPSKQKTCGKVLVDMMSVQCERRVCQENAVSDKATIDSDVDPTMETTGSVKKDATGGKSCEARSRSVWYAGMIWWQIFRN